MTLEPGDSGAGAAAVEVVPDAALARPLPTFVHGALAGLSAAAVLAHVWLAVELAPLLGMYRDLAARPEGMRAAAFVLQPRWLWGVPAAGAVALAVLLVRRPRRVVWYVALAAVLFATAIGTWHLARAPIDAVADTIRE